MPFLRQACTTLVVAVLLASAAAATDRGLTVASPEALYPQSTWGNYNALIIGIDDYQQWPRLRTAVKDATALSQVLVDRYGFDKSRVILRTDLDANRLQIISDIRAMATSLKPDDNLLIYFAGHGQLDDLTGDGYWIPVDGQAKNPGTWIANSFLKAVLSSEKVAAKNVVVIADSCYSGAMLRGGPSLLTVDGDYARKLANAAAKRSRQVISSGGVEPVADGGADGHSLFAYYFLKALNENDLEVMDLENLFHTRVWKPVTEIGNQRPNVGRLKSPMDDDGQFVLYNQAWVTEQQNRKAENRRQAEAAAMKTAEEMDRSEALQAERRRLELERQKLEMEKELLVQKQQVELWKLKLEKQKQEIEFQKMAQQLEAMKQKTVAAPEMPAVAPVSPPERQQPETAPREIAPQPDTAKRKTQSPPTVPVLASVSPEAAAAPRVAGTATIAILPIDCQIRTKVFGNALTIANALVDATAKQTGLAITHSFYDGTAAKEAQVIHLSSKDAAAIWKSTGMFSDPEPDMDKVVALGRKLGVDYAYCAFAKEPGTVTVRIYLFDIARNRKHAVVLKNVNGWSMKAQTAAGLEKLLRELQIAPTETAAPATVASKAATAPGIGGPAATVAVLPMKMQHSGSNVAVLTLANALMDAIGDRRNVRVSHSFYPSISSPDNLLITLSSKETDGVWAQSGIFSDPEPDVDAIVALGKKLGVDYAYCASARTGSDGAWDIYSYLIDIKTKAVQASALKHVGYLIVKQSLTDALDNSLSEMGLGQSP